MVLNLYYIGIFEVQVGYLTHMLLHSQRVSNHRPVKTHNNLKWVGLYSIIILIIIVVTVYTSLMERTKKLYELYKHNG